MGTVNPLLTQAESSHTGMLAPAPVPLLKVAAVESESLLPLNLPLILQVLGHFPGKPVQGQARW